MIEVKILNPEVLMNLYKNHGKFACACYDTSTKYAEKVGESCNKSGHMSGSRCEYIKFEISGVDRGTSEQMLRHEIGVSVPIEMQDCWSFSDYSEQVIDVNPSTIVKNMASFRYIDKNGFEYITPKNIKKDETTNRLYIDLMKHIERVRCEIRDTLISNGVDKHKAVEDANMVLPRATTTKFVIGFTPEALIHFMHKRLCTRAQEYIREIAIHMKSEVMKFNETYGKELVPHCQFLLWCPEGDKCCGIAKTRQELKNEINEK